jgi:type I restriction enzyme M protein
VIGKRKYKADLIPPGFVIARYFRDEQEAIEKLELEMEGLDRQMEEMKEGYEGDEGLLNDIMNDKGKITKRDLITRLKELSHNSEDENELAVLEEYLTLLDKETAAKKQIKDANEALSMQVAAKYPELTEANVKTLVVEDKWFDAICSDIKTEVDRVSGELAGRVKQLYERYAVSLPVLSSGVEELSTRVDEHLKKMGFVWN